MGEKDRYNSLLPYLHPTVGHCFHLSLSLKSQTPQVLEKISYPFVTVESSNPFAHVLEASILTDVSSPVKRLFLVIQRARPLISTDPLLFITNEQIAKLWQTSFDTFSKHPDAHMVRLSCQTNSDGVLSPLRPLLFCKEIKRFFHPLCPQCGTELDQCEDDKALASNQLPLFSATLHRYLYCNSCLGEDKRPVFYTEVREDEDADVVGDAKDLIQGFSSLIETISPPHDFPCLDCDNSKECYGKGSLALTRIVPLSFLPFYMLAFEAPTLPVADFLPLISRAQRGELVQSLEEQGETARITRLDCLLKQPTERVAFLHQAGDSFLEVLFLKLAFLKQVLEIVELFVPPLSLGSLLPSLGTLWVKLPEPDCLLPTFWDFHVRPVGLLVKPSALPHVQKPPPAVESITIAVLWSYIFITNKTQGVEEVIATALNMVDHPVTQPEELPAVFHPTNIFWDPQYCSQLSKEHLHIWQEVVELGLMAFKGWQGKDKTWSLEKFKEQVVSISSKIKEALFKSPLPGLDTSPQEGKTVATGIIHILRDILAEWEAEEEIAKKAERSIVEPIPEKAMAERVPLQETIIISPGAEPPRGPGGFEAPEKEPIKKKQEVILQETIIVSSKRQEEPFKPKGPKEEGGTPPHDSESSLPPDMPETIILSDLQAPSTPDLEKKPKKQEDLDKEFEETLSILDQELMSKKGESKPPLDESLPKRISQDQDIPETIIISPGQKPPREK